MSSSNPHDNEAFRRAFLDSTAPTTRSVCVNHDGDNNENKQNYQNNYNHIYNDSENQNENDTLKSAFFAAHEPATKRAYVEEGYNLSNFNSLHQQLQSIQLNNSKSIGMDSFSMKNNNTANLTTFNDVLPINNFKHDTVTFNPLPPHQQAAAASNTIQRTSSSTNENNQRMYAIFSEEEEPVTRGVHDPFSMSENEMFMSRATSTSSSFKPSAYQMDPEGYGDRATDSEGYGSAEDFQQSFQNMSSLLAGIVAKNNLNATTSANKQNPLNLFQSSSFNHNNINNSSSFGALNFNPQLLDLTAKVTVSSSSSSPSSSSTESVIPSSSISTSTSTFSSSCGPISPPGGWVEPNSHFVIMSSDVNLLYESMLTAFQISLADCDCLRSTYEIIAVVHRCGQALHLNATIFKHEKPNHFIVELQRRRGDSFHFYEIYRRVKLMVESADHTTMVNGEPKPPSPLASLPDFDSSPFKNWGLPQHIDLPSLDAEIQACTKKYEQENENENQHQHHNSKNGVGVNVANLTPQQQQQQFEQQQQSVYETLDCLMCMASSEYVDVAINGMNSICAMSNTTDPITQHMLCREEFVNVFIELLQNNEEDLHRVVLTTLANITRYSSTVCATLLNSEKTMKKLFQSTQSTTKQIVRESARTMSTLKQNIKQSNNDEVNVNVNDVDSVVPHHQLHQQQQWNEQFKIIGNQLLQSNDATTIKHAQTILA